MLDVFMSVPEFGCVSQVGECVRNVFAMMTQSLCRQVSGHLTPCLMGVDWVLLCATWRMEPCSFSRCCTSRTRLPQMPFNTTVAGLPMLLSSGLGLGHWRRPCCPWLVGCLVSMYRGSHWIRLLLRSPFEEPSLLSGRLQKTNYWLPSSTSTKMLQNVIPRIKSITGYCATASMIPALPSVDGLKPKYASWRRTRPREWLVPS